MMWTHTLLQAFLIMILAFCGCSQGPSWPSVKEMVRQDFPDVEHVSADELSRLMATEPENAPILLDVREEAEYAVSHLPHAVRVQPGTDRSAFLDTLDRDAPIVAYCSVGYRSSELVQKLRERGFTNIRNLEGSIFEWANGGRSVERDGRGVEEVHPFDEQWGKLLRQELHAYEPGSN